MPSDAQEHPELYPQLLPCRHQRLHRSHHMLHHRGLWWCSTCGFHCSLGKHGRSAPKQLLVECLGKERRTRAGKGHLNRLARGLHPKVGSDWPDPIGTRVDAMDLLPATRLRRKTRLDDAVVSPMLMMDPPNVPDEGMEPPHDDLFDDALGLALPTGLDTDSDDDVS